MNGRLQAKTLRNEIEILNTEVTDLHKEKNSIYSISSPNSIFISPQRSTSKPQPRSKHSKSPLPSSSRPNFPSLHKENINLKSKIVILERECKHLAYFKEQKLIDSSKAYTLSAEDSIFRKVKQENKDYHSRLGSIGLTLQRFLFSLKKFNRSVLRKDHNMNKYKREFENSKAEI